MGPRLALLTVAAIFAVFAAPVAAAPDRAVERHRQGDKATLKTVEKERAMTNATRAATANDAQAAALAVTGTVAEVGSWSAPVDWPVVGVHVALLPNGKVLAYDSVGDSATESYPVHNGTRASVWDPITGTHTNVYVNTGFNVFCSGLAHLLDGSVFLAGGNKDAALNGIRQTHIFGPTDNTWSLGSNMAFERWYPSVTGMGNGEMLITEGGPDTPEVRQRDGTLRSLTTAVLALPEYPWLDVAPDGRAFYSGPDQTMRKINHSGTGAWENYTQRDAIDRNYGGHAMFDIGKILVAGGGPSVADARVIDINGTTPRVSQTAPMAFGRRQSNLTLLADGTALSTGGNSSGARLVDLNAGVYAAELWNPGTGLWKTMAAQQVTRQYHSTATLLPDGRVLSSGGGICGTCDQVGYLAKNAEIFTPPYLYKKDGSGELAPRPSITSAPASIDAGTQFAVSTPDAASITKLGLVRLGAVTHSVDMDQRYTPLAFTAGSGTLTVTAPANLNIAPPGPYMLFAVNSAGVPSIAKMVSVAAPLVPVDKALNKPATASSTEAPGLEPKYANDGNPSTRWSSAFVDNQWWQVDLGQVTSVGSVELTWENAYASTYKIQTSNDGTTFSDAATENIVSAGTKSTTFAARDARYVRVLGVTRATPYGISLWGVRVFGPAATPPPPPPPPPPNKAPSVTITSPTNGAVFKRGASITIEALASDSDGTVTKVEFFRGDGATKLGEDTTAPYSFVWTGSRGTHLLRARATDNGGAVTLSDPVSIQVVGKA